MLLKNSLGLIFVCPCKWLSYIFSHNDMNNYSNNYYKTITFIEDLSPVRHCAKILIFWLLLCLSLLWRLHLGFKKILFSQLSEKECLERVGSFSDVFSLYVFGRLIAFLLSGFCLKNFMSRGNAACFMRVTQSPCCQTLWRRKTASVAWLVQPQSSQVAGSGTGTEGIMRQSDEVWEIRRRHCFKWLSRESTGHVQPSGLEQEVVSTYTTWSVPQKLLYSYRICIFLGVTLSSQRGLKRSEPPGDWAPVSRSSHLCHLPPQSAEQPSEEALTPACFLDSAGGRLFKCAGFNTWSTHRLYIITAWELKHERKAEDMGRQRTEKETQDKHGYKDFRHIHLLNPLNKPMK